MGRGNSNLIAWDGSKTMTFTVEDALFSAIGISILMGADIAETTDAQEVHVHKMVKVTAETSDGSISGVDNRDIYLDLSSYYRTGTTNTITSYYDPIDSATATSLFTGLTDGDVIPAEVYVQDTSTTPTSYKLATIYDSGENYYLKIDRTNTGTGVTQQLCTTAPLYVMAVEEDGSIIGDVVAIDADDNITSDGKYIHTTAASNKLEAGKTYMVDFYVVRKAGGVKEIQVRKDKFAGYFYVEAETLFRRQDTGADMPAVITIPKVKIQSNFSIAMSADGDPSTATFTMDAFPDYTYFDKTKEVLCVIQVVDDNDVVDEAVKSVMLHTSEL